MKEADKVDELAHAYGGSIKAPATRLEWWNYYILQWFFIRICWRRIVDEIKMTHGTSPYEILKSHKQYGLLIGVYPFSGWGIKPFKYLFKNHFIWFKSKA